MTISVNRLFFSIVLENTMTEASVTSVTIPEKKPFPEDRAIKLAMAREKALEVRRKNKQIRLQSELDKMKSQNTPKEQPVQDPVVDTEPIETIVAGAPDDIPDPVEEPVKDIPKVAPVKKKKNKRQMVVVEQSSDDSDEFEHNQNVVFVKRVRKKKEKVPEPVVHQPPPPQAPPSPPSPPPPQKPMMTPQQQQIASYYNTMFNGNFLQGNRRR